MDITALNAQIFSATNSSYVPFSASGGLIPVGLQSAAQSGGIGLPAAEAAGRADGFEGMLRRLQDAGASNDEAPAARVFGNEPIDRSSQLYELCLELETFLIKNLIKSMRNTIQKTNLIDTGFAGEMYEDMLYDEYAKDFTRNANLGFAEMAYRELTNSR